MKHGSVSTRKRPTPSLLLCTLTYCLCALACGQSDQAKKPSQGQLQDTSAVDSTPIAAVGTTSSRPSKPDEIPATSDPAVLAMVKRYKVDCAGKRIDLADPVKEIAAAITADLLLYDTEPLTDCSGIFHRVLQKMKQRCPAYDYPLPETYRDTRDLARWYHEHGDLILVQNALASAELIKPGAVLFYGQRDSVYKNFTVEKLFLPKVGINHMGVVVKVDTNAAGETKSYELFHGYGRKGITPASTTNWHLREPTRAAYPPLGNGREQWVAMARLLNPSTKPVTAK